jgi:hypothetical protein
MRVGSQAQAMLPAIGATLRSPIRASTAARQAALLHDAQKCSDIDVIKPNEPRCPSTRHAWSGQDRHWLGIPFGSPQHGLRL